MKKICFISGSRADYGLMTNLMKLIKKEKNLLLQLIVTGTHLSSQHGYTYREILKDNFSIDARVDLKIRNYKPYDICKYMGLAIDKISKNLKYLKPDLVVLLGDRYEIFAAASASLIHQIPICHIHGGEITEGSVDDSLRHAITKMSNLHFVSSAVYKKRVNQLGENPKNIFVVGGFGVDLIKKTKLISKEKVEKSLGFRFKNKNLLVSYHPETTNSKNLVKDFSEVLSSLEKFNDIQVIFTKSNADVDGNLVNRMINNFVIKNKLRSCFFDSMGQVNYLSTLNLVDGILGNSSSGILEAPTFNKPTINIGNRQKGRLKAKSVIDVPAKAKLIEKAIKKIYSLKMKQTLHKNINPYGFGGASNKTIKILKKIKIDKLNKNFFFDIN